RGAIRARGSRGGTERRGTRAYVTERLPDVVVAVDGRQEFVSDLFETGRVIEVPMAELATCRASEEARQEIAAIADRFTSGMPIEDFRRLDREFHWAIARACSNNLLAEVYFKVLDALFSADEFAELLFATSNRDEVAVIVEQSIRQHRA